MRINGNRNKEISESEDDDSNAYSSVHEDDNARDRRPSLGSKKAPAPSYPPPRSVSSKVSSHTKANRMFGDSVQHSEESDASSIVVGGNMSRNDNNNNRLLNARDLSSTSTRQNLLNGVRKMSKGGSVSSNASSVMSAASAASSNSVAGRRGGSLANIYQARKNSVSYDATTVNQIKAQFQAQIESMLQSQERNTGATNVLNTSINGQAKPSIRASVGHIQSTSEKELNIIKDLQRGKSFDEARNAVQKQIERIFSNNHLNGVPNGPNSNGPSNSNPLIGSSTNRERTNTTDQLPSIQHGHLLLHNPVTGAKVNSNGAGMMVKHGMHGVSHALPGELDDDIRPPPIHYGINQAIKTGNFPMNRNGQNNISYAESRSNDDLSMASRSNKFSSQADARFDPTSSQQNRRLGYSHESLLDHTADMSSTSVSAMGLPNKSANQFSSSSPRLIQNSSTQEHESHPFKSPSNRNLSISNVFSDISGNASRSHDDSLNSSNQPFSRNIFSSSSGTPLGNIDMNVRKTTPSLQPSKIVESRGNIHYIL